MPRAFFFPHALGEAKARAVRTTDTPGRVPFVVSGPLVSASESDVLAGTAAVFGDGYWKTGHTPAVGSNQDPCIFSSPIGLFHSFCRIDATRGADNYVVPLQGRPQQLLPDVVAKDDVIFYGKPKFTDQQLIWVAVDAVLVVATCEAYSDMRARLRGTDAYGYNLIDGEVTGLHAASPGRPAVIVGASQPNSVAVTKLASSFVPLATKDADGRWQVCRVRARELGQATWRELEQVVCGKMFVGPAMVQNKGLICELPRSAAEALAGAIVKMSGAGTTLEGRVAVPPLLPARPMNRLDPRSAEVVGHAEYVSRYGR